MHPIDIIRNSNAVFIEINTVAHYTCIWGKSKSFRPLAASSSG